jgi:hypothetical protein
MSDNLDRYLPEFDEEDTWARLAGFTREQLLDMLVYAYKKKRVWLRVWASSGKSSIGFKTSSRSPPSSSKCLECRPRKTCAE